MTSFWDRIAEGFEEEVIEQAASVAAALDRAGPTLQSLAEQMATEAERRDPPVGDILRIESRVLAMQVGTPSSAASWGQSLVPEWGIEKRAFRLEHIPEDLEGYARLRVGSAHAAAVARWYDVLLLRWRRRDDGTAAIDALLRAAAAAGQDILEVMQAQGHLTRAADWALRLNQRRPETCAAAREALRAWSDADWTLSVLELTKSSARLLSIERDETIALARDLLEIASRNEDEHGRRQLLEAAAELARQASDTSLRTDALRGQALSFEAEAAASGNSGLAQIHWLREAIRLYAELGDSASLDRVQRLYEQAGRAAQSELRTVSGTIVYRREDIGQFVDQLRLAKGASLAGYLTLPLELGFFRGWSSVRQDRMNAESQHVFVALASHVSLEADGRVQPQPDQQRDPEDHERARDVAFFGRETAERVKTFLAILAEMRDRGLWSASLATGALAMVDEDLAVACEPGLARYEAGDFWSACHVLMPQIERAVRVLGRLAGADQTRFAPQQGIRWASLNDLLADEGIAGSMGDKAPAMAAVLVDEQGPNIRNNIAHGALATDTEQTVAATVALMAILTVCYFVVLERQRTSSSPD